MATMNISVTQTQAAFIDQLITKHGYGNRSELFRSFIRLLERVPSLVEKADENLLYGSASWWKQEIMEAKKETAAGKGRLIRKKTELDRYLNTLIAKSHHDDSFPS